MQAWWRVLRGVWPYRTLVVISIICALGVGLSYASGVAVMLPVLKIFISTEGIHGWADREAAQDRLGVTLWDLDQTVAKGQSGAVIDSADAKRVASLVLNPAGQPYKVIAQVTYDEGQITQSAEKQQWRGMMNMMARAPAGGHLTMVVRGTKGEEVVLKGMELRRASPSPSTTVRTPPSRRRCCRSSPCTAPTQPSFAWATASNVMRISRATSRAAVTLSRITANAIGTTSPCWVPVGSAQRFRVPRTAFCE